MPRVIAGRLARDSERAWEEFLQAFAPLVLQVVHLFERDEDRADDCFVFVCEQLHRNDLRRLRRFDIDGPASFSTWLRAVVRNLCLDWRRSRFGRPRPFRVVSSLSDLDQEVYRAVHLRGMSESEALETVRHAFPDIGRIDLATSLERIAESLSSHQSWLLASRRVREVPLSGGRDRDERAVDMDPADTRPDPEEVAARDEELDALQAALAALSPRDRLMVRMRFEQDLTLDEIARLAGVGRAATVQRAISRAVETMRLQLGVKDDEPASVKEDQRGMQARDE